MLAAVSTQNKLLLGGMAVIFIVFALVSALLIPRTRPEFPGKRRNAFLGGTVLLFVAMLLAVEFFAVEEEEAHAGEPGEAVEVVGKEYSLAPAQTTLSPGTYDFELVNEGDAGHNLVVNGPGVEDEGTPVIEAGEEATLHVALVEGEYELYCSVPGHRDAGMETTVTVGG